MLYISDKAKHKLEIMKTEQKLSDQHFIRISVLGGGCSGLTYDMKFDNVTLPDDEVFEDKGVKLIADKKSILYLFGTTLDFSDGLNGKGFQFINPNADRTCSCGESFSV